MQNLLLALLSGCLACVAALGEDAPPIAALGAPELQRELLSRMEIDQAARIALVKWEKENGPLPNFEPSGDDALAAEAGARMEAMPPEYRQLVERMSRIDADNTAWLQGVVDRHGWPPAELVGDDGASAAWLLVQHADADIAFQRRCLDLMAQLPAGAVRQQDFAYLTDRVLLAEGEKQRYGTQFVPVAGRLTPRPTEDEANLDARRAAVGLPPMAEYIKMAEKFYGYAKKADAGGE